MRVPVVPSPTAPFLQGEPVLQKVGDFDQPIYVTAPKDDPRLFVVEKTGRVKVLPTNDVFLDLSKEVSNGNEQGLFSLAFAPDYAASGLAYVDYTDLKGDTRVVEFKVDPANRNRLEPASRREVLFVKQPFPNHNGGLVLFDTQGRLIVGFGDGGSGNDPGNRAQDPKELLGKLLRIDLTKPNTPPEILAFGLRNPWRFSYDAEGNLWVGDVGQNAEEEVNRVPAASVSGANFGWRKYEGNMKVTEDKIDESKLIRPVFTYPTSSGCSVTG
ncbi:MAG: PQQ-dependent sugar dehydrogenase, partial [Actinomycetota bacterium]